MYAQKDVTKFLGIPVDGTKTEMMNKLKAKGFVPSSYDSNILEGEFNGFDVILYIGTNNNKVYRIMLCDKICQNEVRTKIRFNRLCRQFENNSNYVAFEDFTIPEDEEISYEMSVNKKRYEAAFYQRPDTTTLAQNLNDLNYLISQKYTQEEQDNPTEEVQEDIKSITLKYLLNLLDKKTVWFKIDSDEEGEYYIAMYYDNKYNEANGEDL